MNTGKFVKSHLIPKAVTRPAIKGAQLIQMGEGTRPTKRWDSWYDDALVIQEGENILSALDDWAIRTLRDYRLIWSGWGKETSLEVQNLPMGLPSHGYREIEGLDQRKLRLFVLSLLWRAAATSRSEFDKVIVPDDDLEKIRRMLVEGDPGLPSFYPTSLTQLSTIGPQHNFAPIADEMFVPEMNGKPSRVFPFFRFYLEGLIIRIHNLADGSEAVDYAGPAIIGFEKLVVTTVTSEDSFQMKNLFAVVNEHRELWVDRSKLSNESST